MKTEAKTSSENALSMLENARIHMYPEYHNLDIYRLLSRPNYAGSVAEVRGTIGSIKAFLHHRDNRKSRAPYPMATNDSSQ